MERYIGKVLSDRYMITEVIGVGGMAYVYKAFDKVCNRVVAVKILKDEFMSDTQFRRRFTNESKAITMLSQENIVDVYDVSLEGDALYIVMEYIDGITLKEYMERKGALSSMEALHFIKQILRGIAHAHERGIVHRDIKPHNIMLLKDGTIKITDFGIARLTKFDTQTISDMTIGSVHYISPEQASGDNTDARSDIYSVGIILYEMITGKLPFEADTAVAVALKQVQAQPVLPRDLNPEIPQGLEDITLKAMMKDPAIRYQSAAAFLSDIAMFEEDPSITFDYSAGTAETVIPNEDNSPTLFASSLSSAEQVEDPAEEEEEYMETADLVEEKIPSKFKSTWLPILAGVGTAFVLLILVALGIIFQKELFGSKTVKCPNVVGMDLDKAKAEYNFTFVVKSTEESDKYAVGEIISQDPVADTMVRKKSKISVVICGKNTLDTDKVNNGGDGTNYVPDVLKMSKSAAISKFKEQEISYRIETRASDTIEEGYVIATSPSAGEEINDSTVVTVYISSGPEEKKPDEITQPETVTVPDLYDMSEANAKTTLSNNKLSVGTISEDYSDTVEKGNVISQSVKEGTSVEAGTAINFVISLGPKEEEPAPTPIDEDPNKKETAEATATLNLSDYKEKETVEISAYLSADDSQIYGPVTVTLADLQGANFEYSIDLGEYEVGTVIYFTVDGEEFSSITVG